MAAVKGIYSAGKNSHMIKGVKHDTGKGSVSHGGMVTAAAGKNSGTARGGDMKGCKPSKGC